MKIPARELLHKFQLLLIIVLGTIPFILVLFGHKGASLLTYIWIYPAVYMLLSLLCFHIPGRWRLACSIVICLAALAASIVLPENHQLLAAILGTVFYSVLFLWTLPMAAWSASQEISGLWVTAGIIFHLIGQFYLYMDKLSRENRLVSVSGWMIASLFAFVFLTMISMNRRSLIQASGKRQKASVAMGRKNKVMILVLFAISLLAAVAPSMWLWIKAAILWAWDKILRLVELIAGESSGEAAEVPPTEGSPFSQIPGGEEAGAFALLTQNIVMVVGGIIAAVLIGYLLLRFSRFVTRILRRLFALLVRYAASAAEDYEDEITTTREQESVYARVRQYFSQRVSLQQERMMLPDERVRYRYKRMALRHNEWDPGSTARENLPVELADIYERARYSGSVPTADEAEFFAEKSRKI